MVECLKEVEEKMVKFADGRNVYLAVSEGMPVVGESVSIRKFEEDGKNYCFQLVDTNIVTDVEKLAGDIYAITTNKDCYFTKISNSCKHENLEFAIIYERPKRDFIACFVMELNYEKNRPCKFEKEIIYFKNISILQDNIYLFTTRHGIYLCYYVEYIGEEQQEKHEK